MAVPKKKVSPGRRNMRRQFYALKPTNSGNCPNCLNPKLPHRVCVHCGFYNGKQVMTGRNEAKLSA